MIKIYTSPNCPPCKRVEELISKGHYDTEVRVINIESDEGFKEFAEEVLATGDGMVPSAFKEGRACKILFTDDDRLLFECPDESDQQDSPRGEEKSP